MKLYQGNAKELVGKKIDCNIRFFGCYPMEVIETNGKLLVKDARGVGMPIPEKENDFRCVDFDFVLD